MAAEIILLADRRPLAIDDEPCLDLATAVDVAIRDLRDIRRLWGTDEGRRLLNECELLLSRAFDVPQHP